ncbi:MAG: D-aminoacyl-tRNA deacylase [Promethearchaeota archaeon]|jgi:D-aminoacyl-tRNA deacylase
MNIRENFLISKTNHFEQKDFMWHDYPIFELINYGNRERAQSSLFENKIFLGLTKEPLIFLNDLRLSETKINPDILIFASRHTSKTARPAFLAHTTGNWSKDADFGGEPYDLSITSALLHKAGYISICNQEPINNSNLSTFSCDVEVTHHGPTILDKPLIFMELGSSKVEWNIKEAGESLAKTILITILEYLKLKEEKIQKIGLGFGGTHYAPNFKRLIESKDVALSFICPKYYVQELNLEMIRKMIKNTIEPIDYFIIDWKGTNSADKKHLIPLLEEFEIPIKKTKDF